MKETIKLENIPKFTLNIKRQKTFFMFITDIETQLRGGFTGPFSTTIEYIVGGYYTPGDEGGGIFVWISDPTPPGDDGGIIIRNTNNALGYFKRLYTGPINVRWFGATGTGTTLDTPFVQAAIAAAGNGTVYFPAGTYLGNFVAEHCNIIGDGYTTKLLTNYATPVLSLGYNTLSEWTFSKVSSLLIDGGSLSNGIEFIGSPDSKLAGKWEIECVRFIYCIKAIYKPYGNLGNTYINCHFSQNDYGFYAQNNPNPDYMHAGCDHFIGGHIDSSAVTGIYVKSDGQYGQLIIDGTVIEGNPGFGIFIKLTGYAAMTFNGIELRNIWMEQNATNSSVTIDGIDYTPRALRFENVRSVSISQMLIMDIELIASSVNLYNCHSDNNYLLIATNPSEWPYSIDVDSTSSLVAYELRYAGEVSDNIFVNSISYDGTGDIASALTTLPIPNINIATSVWGPLRVVNQYGTYNLKMSQRFYRSGPRQFESVTGGADIYGYDQNGGVLKDQCIALDIPAYDVIRSNNDIWYLDPASEIGESYYVWSIHSFACLPFHSGNTVSGVIRTESGIALGQVFFRHNQWSCSYGVKK